MCYSDPFSVIILIALSYPPIIWSGVKNLLTRGVILNEVKNLLKLWWHQMCGAQIPARPRRTFLYIR